MLQKVYLAECSETYRQLFMKLLAPFSQEVIDLWQNPDARIDESADCMIIADEAFLSKGPGTSRFNLCALFTERRITQASLLLLERREKTISLRLNSRVLKLRRPFLVEDLVKILSQLGLQAEFQEREAAMSESNIQTPSPVEVSDAPENPETILETSTEEQVEEASEEAILETAPEASVDSVDTQEVLEAAPEEVLEEITPSEEIEVSAEAAPHEEIEAAEVVLAPEPIAEASLLLSDDINVRIEQAIQDAIARSNLTEKVQEILEKSIRETVPNIAEKLIKEEIERLTR